MNTRLVEIDGRRYFIREATRGELATAYSFRYPTDGEDYLVDTCLIEPKIPASDMYAGVPEQLAWHILEISCATEETVERKNTEAEAWVMSDAGKIEALIMAVLHRSYPEIQNMYSDEWFKSAAAAQLLAAALYQLDLQKYMAIGKESLTIRDKLRRGEGGALPPKATTRNR